MDALSKHILGELYDCDKTFLNDPYMIEKIMNEAANVCGATVIKSVFHLFNPHGVGGVVVIAESHLAIHTWPEHCFASVDVFTCGNTVVPWKAYDFLKKKLNAKRSTVFEMMRGQGVKEGSK